jgi:hypothetical protein
MQIRGFTLPTVVIPASSHDLLSASAADMKTTPIHSILPTGSDSKTDDIYVESVKEPLIEQSYLTKNKAEIERAIHEIEQVKSLVEHAFQLNDKNVYTNEALRKRVDKEQQSQAILTKLEEECRRLYAAIIKNQQLWDEKYKVIYSEFDRAVRDREMHLIEDLLDWQGRMNEEYQAALDQFNKAELAYKTTEVARDKAIQKYQDAKKEFDTVVTVKLAKLDDRSKERAVIDDFLKKYSDVASKEEKSHRFGVLYNLKCIVAPLPSAPEKPVPNEQIVPVREKLESRSMDELQEIVSKTKNQWLKVADVNLEKDVERYREEKRKSLASVTAQFPLSDKSPEHDKLIQQSQDLVNEFEKTAAILKEESKLAYKKIESDKDALEILIAQEEKELAKHYDSYVQSSKSNFSKDEMHERVRKYDRLLSYVNGANKLIADWKVKADAILNQYEDIERIFGLDNKAKKSVSSHLMTLKVQSFTKVKELADKSINDSRPAIQVIEQKIENDNYNQSLLEILKVVRETLNNKISFWHEQIDSFWGSRYKIDKIAVPFGISQMHELLSKMDREGSSAEDKLIQLVGIAKNRTNAGLGFFAKRTQNTTDNFYKAIAGLIIPNKRRKVGDYETILLETNVEKVKNIMTAITSYKKPSLKPKAQAPGIDDAVLAATFKHIY